MKTKVQMELNLGWHVKDKKKGFSKYISNKSRNRKNVGPLLKTGDLVTQKVEMEKVL